MKKLLLALFLLLAVPAFASTPAEFHALFADWRRFHAGAANALGLSLIHI